MRHAGRGDAGTGEAAARGAARRGPLARRAGLMRVCLGDGKNGRVRYIREEAIGYEQARRGAVLMVEPGNRIGSTR